MGKRKLKIVRQSRSRDATRHGIVLKYLDKRYQYVLLDNYHIKEHCNDDHFLMALFRIVDHEVNNSNLRKLYLDPVDKEFKTISELKKTFDSVKWNCALCGDPIISFINDFKPENFVCEKCFDKNLRDSTYIPEKILEDSYRFTKHCQKLMEEDQKKFLKYIKEEVHYKRKF